MKGYCLNTEGEAVRYKMSMDFQEYACRRFGCLAVGKLVIFTD